jgi:hypothetical protein
MWRNAKDSKRRDALVALERLIGACDDALAARPCELSDP